MGIKPDSASYVPCLSACASENSQPINIKSCYVSHDHEAKVLHNDVLLCNSVVRAWAYQLTSFLDPILSLPISHLVPELKKDTHNTSLVNIKDSFPNKKEYAITRRLSSQRIEANIDIAVCVDRPASRFVSGVQCIHSSVDH